MYLPIFFGRDSTLTTLLSLEFTHEITADQDLFTEQWLFFWTFIETNLEMNALCGLRYISNDSGIIFAMNAYLFDLVNV